MANAKLKRSDDGGYVWHGDDTWTVKRDEHGQYDVRNERRDLRFSADTLKEVRRALPAAQAFCKAGGAQPEWLYKTPERVEADKKARPQSKKLAAADKAIVDGLKGRRAEAQEVHDKFLREVQDAELGQLPHAIKWCGDAMAHNYMAHTVKHLLAIERPEDRKSLILSRHERLKGELLDGSLFRSESTSGFHRAAAREEREAMHRVFRMLNHYLAVYREEGVDDVPAPVAGAYYY